MKSYNKSYIYRHEVTEAAIKALLDTINKFESGNFIPEKLDYSSSDIKGREHNPIKQSDRSIDWSETTEVIARKIRSADSQPGILDTIYGEEYYLYGVYEEENFKGEPGKIIGKRNGAICRGTGNGAVWISHLKRKNHDNEKYFKLPATKVLGDLVANIKELPLNNVTKGRTFNEIWYEQKNNVGYLYFDFYNGAMSTEQCLRLRQAFVNAKNQDTKVIVLTGGPDFWSNGIHLNIIEGADDQALESWKNINAINDLIKEIILTDTHIVISAIQGNATAGGVILSLSADKVIARDGIVLNPHYKKMGLYGSEYWTYLLPRVGKDKSIDLTEKCLPITTRNAKEIGLVDDLFNGSNFMEQVIKIAEELANNNQFDKMLENKRLKRLNDENIKPLEEYRKEELEKMWNNFYGHDKTYHIARKKFVYKLCDSGNS